MYSDPCFELVRSYILHGPIDGYFLSVQCGPQVLLTAKRGGPKYARLLSC
ncbi:hypothetical protein [Lysobacter antibioticus]|uniref:Uncharacterized protein n=1 Tax=Lysobacter antibioticus TaxID=84531 RepID=A0A0S2FHS4_LYSAN|nr:hypothetical protein [Lysobacter antibioticus]ALN83025.1 hypothetical protein LA76x_4923 [Lysobacter antibioticus]